jgi:single-stranded DNA-binding protein
MNRMHSFSFRSVGNLARNPESIAVLPDRCFTRFCLISNDFVVEDPVCQCCVTSAWFVAVGDLGDELAIKARKGDQLIIEGVILKQHWTDQNKKTEANQRVKQDFIFLVTGFTFGAKRKPPGAAGARVTEQPPRPQDGETAEIAPAAP